MLIIKEKYNFSVKNFGNQFTRTTIVGTLLQATTVVDKSALLLTMFQLGLHYWFHLGTRHAKCQRTVRLELMLMTSVIKFCWNVSLIQLNLSFQGWFESIVTSLLVADTFNYIQKNWNHLSPRLIT